MDVAISLRYPLVGRQRYLSVPVAGLRKTEAESPVIRHVTAREYPGFASM